MKVFISYKYTNHANKDELKQKLGEISTTIESWGDSTFVLGRDVKQWKHIHFGAITMTPVIVKNMKDCGIIYVYVDSHAFSKGMIMELLIAKFLRKKAVLFIDSKVSAPLVSSLVNEVYKINSIHEISKKYI